jgi:nicotinamidase-related amidase
MIPEETSLLVIDYQEKLMPAIEGARETLVAASFLIKSFQALDLPIAYSEQNPERLGATVPEIGALLEGCPRLSKMSFSCLGCSVFDSLPIGPSVVVCGVESHVCVLQTTYDLLDNGFRVIVAEDACSSRRRRDHEAAVATMRQWGALVLPAESIVYGLLREAGTERFRAVLELVKEKDRLLA